MCPAGNLFSSAGCSCRTDKLTHMNYLGLDYGQKNIGVALAIGPLAEPLITFSTAKSISLIKALVEKHHIDEIIIGQPDKLLESEFKGFVDQLSILNRPLSIVDETLSSHDARQALLHTSRTRRKNSEHAVAATIILQSFLDYQLSKS